MTRNQLFKSIDYFWKLAEDLPSNSKNLKTILENLAKIETFTGRVEYAEKNLDRLSSGTSRVIFTLPGKKEVLKLAKNERGVAQNKVESKVKCKYVNPTTKSDPDGIWKISPFLDKITETEFEKLSGVNFKEFGEAMSYALKDISEEKADKPDNYEQIIKADICQQLLKAAKKWNLMPADISRISSWARCDKVPMLVDAGLTRAIYDEFYE